MYVDLSKIPYTSDDECRNIELIRRGICDNDSSVYDRLLESNSKLITYIAKCFKKSLRLNVSYLELECYATEAFYLACRAYNFNGTFVDFTVFYMEQFIFYQVYTEYFLTALPKDKRYKIEKLYNSVLKYLDKGSPAYPFTAVIAFRRFVIHKCHTQTRICCIVKNNYHCNGEKE